MASRLNVAVMNAIICPAAMMRNILKNAVIVHCFVRGRVHHLFDALYRKAEEPADIGYAKADSHADNGRQDKGNQSPFYALRFLFYGHTGSGAGPVHQ